MADLPPAPDHEFDPDPDAPSSPFCMKCPQMRSAHPNQADRRPHSRACGITNHPHGSACAPDCPSCDVQYSPTRAPFTGPQERVTLSVYTTDSQTEQPYIFRDVTAFTAVGGLLSIECDVKERDYTYSAHAQWLPEKWHHFEVHRV